jgi:thiol-disulfide isomerase/thioredoxin
LRACRPHFRWKGNPLKRILSIAVLGLLWVSAGVAGAGSQKPASLTLKDLHGAKVKLSDLRGKVVVLNFWATWCTPCDAEMPLLVKSAAAYEGKNVVYVGVSVDAAETQGKIPAYLKQRDVTYPIWIGATDDDMKHFQLGNAVPATMFLDSDGVVRARILGQMRPGEIEERVDWLLNGQKGTAPEAVVRHLEEK